MMTREELQAALAWYADMTYLDEEDAAMVTAARKQLALMPLKRAGRVELGEHGASGVFHNVYPQETVEKIANVLSENDFDSDCDGTHHIGEAVAVLDALGETE